MTDHDYPRLTPEGEAEAQRIMDVFRRKMRAISDDVLGDLYTDVAQYIESDSWTNFRNHFISSFRRLDPAFCGVYNLRELARVIAKENPELVGKYVNEGNIERIRQLEDTIKFLRESRVY